MYGLLAALVACGAGACRDAPSRGGSPGRGGVDVGGQQRQLGVIHLSIGPRARARRCPGDRRRHHHERHVGHQGLRGCLKVSAAMTSGLSWAPAASQKAGSTSLMGTLVT